MLSPGAELWAGNGADNKPGPGAIEGAKPGAKGDVTRDTTADELQHTFKESTQEAWLETGTLW